MRVSLSWLRDFVAIDMPVEQLADRLSLTGLAVEETIRTGEGIEGVVVGRVLEVRDHPTSSKPLVLVKADVGESEPLDIVCGARNFSAGDLVPVAAPGARLPGGFEIVRRKLAGEVSNGMLCSARELGVSDDHSGIMVLDEDLKLGEDVRGALGLDDVIFDIDITPNRPDCLSVLGVAREIAALYGVPLNDPAVEISEAGPPIQSVASVVVQDLQGCPRYVARVVAGLRPGASPWWMRRRLLAAGMRPISAVVDVTNYVMLERGQPLHAFDLANLRGHAVVVRRAADGERLVTLDGIERPLDPDDLMICDADRAVAIAGVMGGGDTEVTETTTDVLIESAYFDPVRILRTARRAGLRTEASVRFERGVDTEGAPRAADRAVALLIEVAGGTAAAGSIVAGPGAEAPAAIHLSVSQVNARIGIQVAADDVAGIVRSLGCRAETAGGDAWSVTPPTWRPDLRIQEDLAEEVARIYGYDRVPVRLPAGGRSGGLTRPQELRRVARRAMLGAGLSEAQTLSLISAAVFDRLDLPADHAWRSVVRVTNPLSEDESVLRPSLLPGLLMAAQRNVARRSMSVALFEIGVSFRPTDGELPDESLDLAWIMTGPRPTGWHGPSGGYDFYDAKGVAESLCATLGARDVHVRATDLGAPFHPARSAVVLAGERVVGRIAELHPRAAEGLDLPGRVAVGLVHLGDLFEVAEPARALPLTRFPAVERDVALIVPASQESAEAAAVIRRAAGPLLESVAVFDVYRGPQIGEGNVSLAFGLVFRSDERTLTDPQVDEAMAAIAAAVTSNAWSIRE